MKLSFVNCVVVLSLSVASAQPVGDVLEKARVKIDALSAKLSKANGTEDIRVDAEIYLKAGQWLLRHPEEFYKPEYSAQLLSVLDRGLARAAELEAGSPTWPKQKGRFSRAYRSRVDGSVQPYGMIIPENYDPAIPTRLDVVLHGRAAQMNEVSFLFGHDSPKPPRVDQNHLVLEVFGRTNNAYRWAGETDVFEALESVRKRYNIDPNRIVLRGFSMGGAGTWHIGLHYPDQWAAIEAGAGFAETKIYAKLPADTPEYQLRTLHIYDAADYAENAANVPTVGYGGEIDPQLKASQLIQQGIAGLQNIKALFLVGPQTGHKWHPESLKQSDEFLNAAVKAGRQTPDRIHFITYTARYNRCFWLTVDALDRHYERAEVDGTRDELKTRNVAALTLDREESPTIDGQKPGRGKSFIKDNGKWRTGTWKGLRKRHGLQGPIDDAFLDSFVAVDAPEKVRAEWAKWMRADLPTASSPQKGKAVVLFGDPQTNPAIKKINEKLPVRWSGEDIIVAEQRFPARDHTLAMIYPNPQDPEHYVVLNSGLTFGEREFKGTNALLYPRLGDYAVIRKSDGKVMVAGIFDEQWRLAPEKR
ncbi:MAG TPA: prolyl oligopeptidase family serine peptidase [Bryobacteraceae bacterium]|nr:prolyl oligopeptidase family serine peptidase [Bryobacteraceae bacterium]